MENINKNYLKKQVLFDFSLCIQTDKKAIYGLVGPNGAGKTTIIKILTGLLNFSSGSISTDESDDYLKWCRQNVVLIPAGERGIRYKNTIYDNVLFFAAMKGISEKTAKQLLNKYAELLNYSELLTRRVETLSMGQKKKAMILCGLCTDMKVIIMDEPSNGLDIDARMEMKNLIMMLVEKLNKTFIISSHDLDFLSGMIDHYIFIFQGKNRKEINGKMQAQDIQSEYVKLKNEYEG